MSYSITETGHTGWQSTKTSHCLTLHAGLKVSVRYWHLAGTIRNKKSNNSVKKLVSEQFVNSGYGVVVDGRGGWVRWVSVLGCVGVCGCD